MPLTSTFTLDSFDQEQPHSDEDGVAFSRARIEKTFSGDIVGTSNVEMLASRAPSGGAGYVALERIRATFDGKTGTFALLHIGTMTSDTQWAKWPIVPGSGTGELAGINGEATIERDEDGTHRFTLECGFS